jgi:hypothetical protein
VTAHTVIVVERVVRCPFSVAHDYAEDFLRDAAGGVVEARVPLRDFIWALRGRFHRPVKLVFKRHLDTTDAGRQHDAMLIDWSAGTALFPDFHGHLRMRIASVETTRLTFEGSYEPPFGPPGRVFDAVLGRRIARATMTDLLKRIGDALERREDEFRAGIAAGGSSAAL